MNMHMHRATLARRSSSLQHRNPLRIPLRFPNRQWQVRQVNTSTRSQIVSHMAAGVLGGSAVIAGIYSYYHFSGIKQQVDSLKSFSSVGELGRVLLQNLFAKPHKDQPSPNEAFFYLRNAAKAYAAWIPGSGIILDKIFDEAGSVYKLHREEANKITLRAYKDISAIVQGSPDGIGNLQTANKVGVVLRRWGEEMHALGMTAGGGAVASLWERHPKAMEALGRSLEHFKTVAEDTGEGSRKLFDDVKQTVETQLAPVSSFVQEKIYGVERSKTLRKPEAPPNSTK